MDCGEIVECMCTSCNYVIVISCILHAEVLNLSNLNLNLKNVPLTQSSIQFSKLHFIYFSQYFEWILIFCELEKSKMFRIHL